MKSWVILWIVSYGSRMELEQTVHFWIVRAFATHDSVYYIYIIFPALWKESKCLAINVLGLQMEKRCFLMCVLIVQIKPWPFFPEAWKLDSVKICVVPEMD